MGARGRDWTSVAMGMLLVAFFSPFIIYIYILFIFLFSFSQVILYPRSYCYCYCCCVCPIPFHPLNSHIYTSTHTEPYIRFCCPGFSLVLPLRIFPPAHLLIFVSLAPRHHDETTTATINPSPPPPSRPSVLVPSSLCVRARVRAWEQAAVVAPPPLSPVSLRYR